MFKKFASGFARGGIIEIGISAVSVSDRYRITPNGIIGIGIGIGIAVSVSSSVSVSVSHRYRYLIGIGISSVYHRYRYIIGIVCTHKVIISMFLRHRIEITAATTNYTTKHVPFLVV